MAPLRRVKLTELNAHLVCELCSGYFVDATTIIECLHTFCKTCIVRYLQTSSFCPTCEVQVHKTKPLLSLREDRTLQDVVFKLVPGLFHSEMKRRHSFYKEHPEAGGDRTEQSLRERRHFFHVDDQISLSLEYLATAPPNIVPYLHSHAIKPLKVNNSQQEKQKQGGQEEKDRVAEVKDGVKEEEAEEVNGVKVVHKRYLRCPAAVQVSHLEKFIRLKYSLAPQTHRVDIMHGGDCLVGELTLLDVVYMYKWTEDAPLRLMYTVTTTQQSRKRVRLNGARALAPPDPDAPLPKVPRIQTIPSEEKVKPSVPVSLVKDHGKEYLKGQTGAPSSDKGTDSCDEKVGKCEPDKQLPVPSSNSVSFSKPCSSGAMTVSTPVIQSLPNTSFTSVAAMNSGAVQLSGPAPSRGRTALTTTTPATTTPRVALTHIPSPPVNPVPVSSIVHIPGGPPAKGVSVTVSNNATQPNIGTSPAANVKLQIPQPLMNGLAESGLKPMHIPAPPTNKMLHPIIPTKPRLGRPTNASRIQAANMRPPGARLGDIRHTRPLLTATKKIPPGNMTGRGSQTVCTSLGVQSGLSNINAHSGKVGAAKGPLKRTSEVLMDAGQATDAKEGTKLPQTTNTVHKVPVTVQGTQSSVPQFTASSASPVQTNTPISQGSKTTTSSQSAHTVQQSSETLTNQYMQSTQSAPRPPLQAMQRPASNQLPQRHPGNAPQQRPPASLVNQRASSTQTSQTPSGLHVNQKPNQGCPHSQGNQQPSSQVAQHSQTAKVTQRPTCSHSSQNSQLGNLAQRPPAPKNQGMVAQRMPVTSSTSQRLSPLASRPPGSPAPHRPPPRPASTPAPLRPPGSPAPHRASGSPTPLQTPNNPPPPRPPSNPLPNRPPSSPAPHRPPSSPAPHRPPSSPAPHRTPSSPAPHRTPSSPAPHRTPSSPAPHRTPGSPSPHRQSNNPPPNRPPNSPAAHRQSSTPASHRPPGSPAPHRPPSSPAPHRQEGNATPHPHSTQPPSSTAATSSSSRTSPRASSTSLVSSMTITPIHRESSSPSVSAPPSNTTAGSSSSNTNVSNGKPGPKLGTPNTNSHGRGRPPANSTCAKTPSTNPPSSTATKVSPKSPGRGRSASNSSTILSIAQTLANRQLQNRTSASSTVAVNTSTTSNIVTTQMGTTQAAPDASSYASNMASGLMSPALAAAAYVATATAYGGDPSAALTDVAAMRNLITLSQTAACIREFNLAAMVKAAETLPRAPEPAPIDLSPTCKAAPHSAITNGRSHTSNAGNNTSTKTTGSHSSKSPSKTSRSSESSCVTTISSPTPEVTITKLPNASISTSTPTSNTGTGKSTYGSTKSGSTNTNTVSITKRPASNNRIAVAKSPANASVRQIPNPSFLPHQSEARNNNNVSKSVPSTSSATNVTNTTSKSHRKNSAGGGRATGNSPLKETGPLPETSSILKMEHLTRSLGAPTPAAAASHGIRYFDDR